MDFKISITRVQNSDEMEYWNRRQFWVASWGPLQFSTWRDKMLPIADVRDDIRPAPPLGKYSQKSHHFSIPTYVRKTVKRDCSSVWRRKCDHINGTARRGVEPSQTQSLGSSGRFSMRGEIQTSHQHFPGSNCPSRPYCFSFI